MTHNMPLNERVKAGDDWGAQQLDDWAHKGYSRALPVLATRWRSCSRHGFVRVPRPKQEGRRQEKGFLFLLSLPKQEETLRLPANILGLNLTSCPSLDSQKGSESDMICLGPETGHIITQLK